MLRNYIKIAIRNLWKRKLFTAINVFGLASGLTVCLLAIAHTKVAYEYDNFHPNSDRTYRILTDVVEKNNQTRSFATSPMPLADVLNRNNSLVEHTTRVVEATGEFTSNNKRLPVEAFAVDADFFKIFGYKLTKGQPATEPRTVVLTRQTAEKFFGTAEPIGKVMEHDELGALTITGILADNPTESHLQFDLLVSLKTPIKAGTPTFLQDWKRYYNGYTYVQLKPGLTKPALEKVLALAADQATRGLRFQTEKGYSLRAQALTQISPATEILASPTSELPMTKLMIELGVGLITILLAAFNYINLTLAQSLSRAREVGIRKVAGSVRWQLMVQFMAESVILALLALGLSVLMLEAIRPMAFVQMWMNGGVHWDIKLWIICTVFCMVVGLLAGLVPARVLSGFNPAQVLRSQMGLRIFKGVTLRKALTVAQFSISLIAMIGLLTMTKQFNYMATADYGFKRHDNLTIPLSNVSYQRLTHAVSQLAGVEHATASSTLLGQKRGDRFMVKRQRLGTDSSVAYSFAVDANFVPTMGLTLLAGRNLPAATTDTSGRFALVNEEALKAFKLGTPRQAIGQSVWLNDSTEVQIAGVVQDFKFITLARPIQPLLLRYQPQNFRYLTVSIAGQSAEATLADIKRVWEQQNPYEPFAGQWYDDVLEQLHNPTEDTAFMGLLIALTFSIACLGLLGMVTYTTQTRTKEVGVRKVMGAEVRQIVWLLSHDFAKLLLIAAVIALPLGYLAGSAFLTNFAYRISVGGEILGLCVGVLLVLGVLTIGIKTYRAALANPADSLRAE